MHDVARQFDKARHVLLLGVGGLSFDVLQRLAERGAMPNMARILPTLCRAKLRQPFFASPISSWTTLETGQACIKHRVLDEVTLDHPRRLLRPVVHKQTAKIDGAAEIKWTGRPCTLSKLEENHARLIDLLRRQFSKIRSEITSGNRRLVYSKLTAFDSLFLHYWHLLGIADESGGRRSWIAATQRVFRVLDEHLDKIFDLSASHRTAVAITSPYGFAPFRGKIILNELLRRQGLLHEAEGCARLRYASSRFFEKQLRQLGIDGGKHRLSGLLPIDWRRSRAVSLHGENAAFIYLNTHDRFAGPLKTPLQQEEAEAQSIAALLEARHPISEEPLFQEAFSTAQRFGIDPMGLRWPEVIGIPASGYLVRQRLDRARQLVRPDAAITAARSGGGFFCWQAPDATRENVSTLDLSEFMGIMEGRGVGTSGGERATIAS